MIHVVTAANQDRYAAEMEEVWRLRHKVFVEEKGWSALRRPDGREIDQFDTAHAAHFLAIENGQVIGYSRLLPTTRPHLLSDVLPELCEGDRPAGPQIWEWTRQAVAPSHRTRGKNHPVTLEVMTGIVEWGLENGVTGFLAQMPILYLLHVLQLHFRAVPLGVPAEIDGERIIAVEARFDARTLRKLQEIRGTKASVLAPTAPTYLTA
ncbi:acyl-homoserine lactone synthase [Methylobacterium sp. 174MFSha1.1]|uniref:acyl-homoserine-lactone synthase n=1 Tax=Methylobacterium sp. 174MFSha1.1 TaxID=1502749 RepID=UPI0008EBB989|nr:acyl-homoserine-lactone synthase [Methylobacterium sp. 174MFSha1.1]SFU43205.1 acyl-homoserine lactone synthase [Methylobacterium sp. 174MFSha1.1]